MNPELESLFKLGREERLQLVQDLWDSLADDTAAVPPWQVEALRARKLALSLNPETALSWEQVQQRARSGNA